MELVRGARWELSAGNIATAETLCREVLTDFADNAECWNMIGVIAAKIGQFEHAARAFQRALEADPGFEKAAGNLTQIEAAPPMPRRPADSPGFLVIKAWGQGFWSDVDHVLGQLLVAEITGRTPVVSWGRNSRFRDTDTADAFGLYFEPVSAARLDDLQDRSDDAYWPPKWSAHNLAAGVCNQTDGPWSRLSALLTFARTEEIVVSDYYTGIPTISSWIPPDHPLSGLSWPNLYRHLCVKYLQPRHDVRARVDAAYTALFQDSRVLAVHARGTDKVDESPELESINARLVQETAAWAREVGASRIFLLSGSSRLVATFRDTFGPQLLTLDVQRSDTDQAIHFQARNGYTLGMEVMVDTYLATHADWFLGNGDSNVSAMIEHLRAWPEGRFRLLRPSIHYRRKLV